MKTNITMVGIANFPLRMGKFYNIVLLKQSLGSPLLQWGGFRTLGRVSINVPVNDQFCRNVHRAPRSMSLLCDRGTLLEI